MTETEFKPDFRLNTLGQIKTHNRAGGGHWFSPLTLRYFSSRVSEMVYPTFSTEHGTFFVSSEKGPTGIRKYTVRQAVLRLDENSPDIITGCEISTVGEFEEYLSRSGAHRAARRIRARYVVTNKGN